MEDISNFFSGTSPTNHPVEHSEGDTKIHYDRKQLEIMKKLNFHDREKVQIFRNRQQITHLSDINYDLGVSKQSIIPGYDNLKGPTRSMALTLN
jgi:hypothetical protein